MNRLRLAWAWLRGPRAFHVELHRQRNELRVELLSRDVRLPPTPFLRERSIDDLDRRIAAARIVPAPFMFDDHGPVQPFGSPRRADRPVGFDR